MAYLSKRGALPESHFRNAAAFVQHYAVQLLGRPAELEDLLQTRGRDLDEFSLLSLHRTSHQEGLKGVQRWAQLAELLDRYAPLTAAQLRKAAFDSARAYQPGQDPRQLAWLPPLDLIAGALQEGKPNLARWATAQIPDPNYEVVEALRASPGLGGWPILAELVTRLPLPKNEHVLTTTAGIVLRRLTGQRIPGDVALFDALVHRGYYSKVPFSTAFEVFGALNRSRAEDLELLRDLFQYGWAEHFPASLQSFAFQDRGAWLPVSHPELWPVTALKYVQGAQRDRAVAGAGLMAVLPAALARYVLRAL